MVTPACEAGSPIFAGRMAQAVRELRIVHVTGTRGDFQDKYFGADVRAMTGASGVGMNCAAGEDAGKAAGHIFDASGGDAHVAENLGLRRAALPQAG